MDIAGITSGSSGIGNSSSYASQDLDKDAFMQLLVSQMQNQDPINPQSNEDFIAQLAQFSSLEQIENLNSSMDKMAAVEESNALINQLSAASSLIGQSVDYYHPQTGELTTGNVESVRIEDAVAFLNIDGESVPLSYLTEINGPATSDDGLGGEGDSGDGDGDGDTGDNEQ
jgi:flagellar basal-body rod modification protein FlgD